MSRQTLRLSLQDVTLDTRLQPRATINEEQVRAYAERLAAGDKFPAVSVFHDGAQYWLADGFHRFYAHRERGETGIMADVHQGGFDEALEYAVGANARHGLPRSRQDTRRAIAALLHTAKWVERSDNWIAEQVRCGKNTVADVREELEATCQIDKLDRLLGKDEVWRPREQGRAPAAAPAQVPSWAVPEEAKPEDAEEEYEEIAAPEPSRVIVLTPAQPAVPEFKPAGPLGGPQAPEGGFLLNEWHDLTAAERTAALAVMHQPTTRTFNEQKDTDNIEWARWSWNPVTGCKHNCIYCYARDIAQRFYPQKFEPTLIPERLAIPYSQPVPAVSGPGYRNVFTCSMADLWGRWVPQEWIDAVLRAVTDNPQWNFLMLTKFPGRMAEQEWPANAWVGTSVDSQARVSAAEKAFDNVKAGVRWLSCEPLLEPLTFSSLAMFDWVVIGAQTRSSQAVEFQPQWEWVESLIWQARQAGCKVYLKTNLIGRPREYLA